MTHVGKVYQYSEVSGQGYLKDNRSGTEYVFYERNLRNMLYVSVGDVVRFKVKQGFGPNEAIDIERNPT